MTFTQLLDDLNEMFKQLVENIITNIPNFIFAIIIIIIGIIIARLLQALVKNLIARLDRFIVRGKLGSKFKNLRFERSARLMGRIVFWIIVVFFLTAATEVIGLPIFTAWLSGLVKYLPNILIAVIIVFLGIIGGKLLRDIVSSASGTAGIAYGSMLGRITQYSVLFLTILIAADQIGIDIGILSGVIDIILGAILFAAALAFGLGARTSVSNILASYYLQNQYQEGQMIKIEDVEGQIIQIMPTAVILDTSEGQVFIPAKKFSEVNSILLKK
jgi:small-conductance mechanosensitive channel